MILRTVNSVRVGDVIRIGIVDPYAPIARSDDLVVQRTERHGEYSPVRLYLTKKGGHGPRLGSRSQDDMSISLPQMDLVEVVPEITYGSAPNG